MTTTEYIAAPSTDKHLAWISSVLAKTKFSKDYADAQIEVTYESVKGERLDTFVTFTLADGTQTSFATGCHVATLNGGEYARTREVLKQLRALVAPPAEDKTPVKAEPVKEEPVAEAAAPAKPKAKAAKPKAKKAKAVKKDKVLAEAEALLGEPMADPAELPPEL